jgi:hypothetical protein
VVNNDGFQDVYDDNEYFDEKKTNVQEVNEWSLPPLALQAYLIFVVQLHANALKVLLVEKKGKENMVIVYVKVYSQMEY